MSTTAGRVAAMVPTGGLDALLRPTSIAILGASDDPTRIGGRPIAYMRARNFPGSIHPVNPNRRTVQGLPAFPSLDAVPGTVEAAIIAVPKEAALDAVRACVRKGVGAAIVFTAGFGETGEEGAALERALVAEARAGGLRLLGPNCLGLFDATRGYFPIFSSSFENGWPLPGRVAIASQSGAFGTHLFALFRDRRVGTPKLVTTGNEADVSVSELIAAFVADPEVDVIAAYLEGVKDGAAFRSALEAARAARKPVVLLKVGRSRLGAAAARSHTAALAGDDAVFDAVVRAHGAHRARDAEELVDVVQAATRRLYPHPNALGVVTISGGGGVLIADAAEEAGLAMPPMPEAAQAKLRALVPFCAPANPVDCTAQAFNDMRLVGAFTETMLAEGGYPSAIGFFTQVGASPSVAPALRAQLKEILARFPDRLFILSILAPPEVQRAYEEDGFLVFPDPSRAVRAVAAMGWFGEAFARTQSPPPLVPMPDLPEGPADETEAKRLLRAIGIATPEEVVCATAEEAAAAACRLGFPVALKAVSPDLLHKSEAGGVLLGLADEAAVREGFARILASVATRAPHARLRGVLVTPMLRPIAECAIGFARDPVFGPVAMVGLGGIFVEVLRDVALAPCPFGTMEAEAMIRSLRGFPLLDGARGRPKADVAALAEALARLSAFAATAPANLRGIDVNPLAVLERGRGVVALDAALELASENDPAPA